jgi:hypothetical protein
MNKRIEQLAGQLGPVATVGDWGRVEWADNVYPQRGDKMYAAVDLAKFAELIVRECVDILDARRKIHTSPTYRSIDSQDRVDAKAEELVYSVMDIKEHFGVKE